jgi:PAS domain S-box-containing protein
MISSPVFLRLLLVEDTDDDTALVTKELIQHGFQLSVTRVATEDEFRVAMASLDHDVIVADYRLAAFSGLDALAIVQEYGRDIPFILLSESIGEEVAVEALHAGAHDYVMKNNLARLGPAIARELHEVEIHRERASNQRLILESEARFRATFEQLAVGLVHVSPSGRCLRVNQRFCAIVGRSRADIEGRDIRVLLTPEGRVTATDEMRTLLNGSVDSSAFQEVVTRADESWAWVQFTASLAHAPGAGEPYIVIVAEDITMRHAAEEALRMSEHRYRTLLEQASDGIFISDSSGRFLDVNDSACTILGFSREELLRLSIQDLVPPEDLVLTPLTFPALAPGELSLVSRRVKRKSGTFIDVEISVKRMADGRVQSSMRDLTERFAAQKQLQVSEARFRTLSRATSDVVYDWDMATGYIWYNENLDRLFHHAPSAITSSLEWWEGCIHPDDRATTVSTLESAIAGTSDLWSAEYRFRTASGDYCYVLDRGFISRNSRGKAVRVIGSMTDLTARKRMEEALRESEERFRALIENASDIIAVIDCDGIVRYESPAIERILGYRSDEIIGTSALGRIHPDDRQRVEDVLAESVATPGVTRRIEHRMLHRDGSVRHIETVGKNLLDHNAVRGLVVKSRGLTERQQVEGQLEQAQRLTSLGRLAANVAHEFNNVMMGIQAFAAVSAKEKNASPQLIRASQAIATAIDRGRRITQEILRFARAAEPSLSVVDVERWIRETEQELHALLGPKHRLILEIAPSCTIQADTSQLTQVLSNLALNARDAMDAREGTLTIRASRPARSARFDFGIIASPDQFIHIEVTDSGAGIPKDALPHIFEPMFTTKRSGTGLGLAVAHQIIQRHGGCIFVESSAGVGTTFHIFLPRTREREIEAVSADVLPSAPMQPLDVLLVEDDELVAEGIAALLGIDGFDVEICGTAACAMARLDQRRPDVVVLDVGLPDADGVELSHRIRDRWPDLPIVFSTGHGDEKRLENLLEHSDIAFLQKPYSAERLEDVLRRVMERASESRIQNAEVRIQK